MHSIEASIIVALSLFVIFRFMTFTFNKEIDIEKNIKNTITIEEKHYEKNGEKDYSPDALKNVIDIINEKGSKYGRDE